MPLPNSLVTDAEVTASWPEFSAIASTERARLIRAASRAVERYVGRTLGLSTVTEVHRPENVRLIYLRIRPVVSITSVSSGHPATTLAASAYSLLDAETGVLELYQGFGGGFRYPDRQYGGDPRSGSVTVVYQGGYATADVPDDLKQAAILAVRYGSSTTTVMSGGLYESEQIGSYSYRRGVSEGASASSAGLPSIALGYLRAWKRPRFA
jgi:hypothetical protein